MHKRNSGFTIVELLVVIVVIAILAAITIVAYNGISNRAHDSAVQGELSQMYQKGHAAGVTGDIVGEQGWMSDDSTRANLPWVTANMKLSASDLDTSEDYPAIAMAHYDYEAGGYTGYDVAAVSKSGKVFVATEDDGGVTRTIDDWDNLEDGLQGDIDYYNDDLNEDWCASDQDCVAYYQAQITYAQAQLQKAHAKQANDGNWWPLDWTCGLRSILGSSWAGYGVYLYKSATSQWVTAIDEPKWQYCLT